VARTQVFGLLDPGCQGKCWPGTLRSHWPASQACHSICESNARNNISLLTAVLVKESCF